MMVPWSPPVRAPTRRVNCVASYLFETPVSWSIRPNSGTNGRSSASNAPRRSNATSAYTMPAVGSSLDSNVAPGAPGTVPTSLGIDFTFFSKSSRPREGIVAKSSAVSGVVCFSFSAAAVAATASSCAGVISSRAAARRASSSAFSDASSVASGFISTVTRCVFFTNRNSSRDRKYAFASLSSASFNAASGASKRNASTGSRS
mmetsp:Transcript_28235/g.87348  ORF Transcript_28235/g.87348 Transcript_28235/m.87348 type:complete len:203 (+) Transcript_28235:476-1084(+)